MLFAKPVAWALAANLLAGLPANAGSRSFIMDAPVQQIRDRHHDGGRRIDCSWPRDRYERRRCDEWRSGNDRHQPRDRNDDVGAAIGLGILGLAVGAIVAGSVAEQKAKERRREQWNRPCRERYGFDRRSGTFIGEDGRRYYCG